MVSSASKTGRSLILAGGGVRLAYHAGVLIALEEAGLSFDHVDGTSGGIFGTAMLASGITPKDAALRWRKLNLDGFLSALPLKKYRNLADLPAIGSAEGIRKKIFPSLGIDVKKINANTTFKATFNVCNFSHKSIESITNEAVTEDYLIAGMSLPIFMPAVKINNDWYTDAVWIKDCNMTGAVNGGAQELWLVWCIGNTHNFLNGSFNQYVHMIEISANGGVFTEIDRLRTANADRIQKGLKPIDLHIIKPEYPLPLDPDFLFNKINADTLINMGYADTKQYLTDKKVFADTEPVYHATAMTTFSATVHFRQQFYGKTNIDGRLCSVAIQLSFFIRQVNGQFIFQQFASISIGGDELISGYNNTIKADDGKIDSAFQFILDVTAHTIKVKIQLHSITDFLIGIDGKTATVNIGFNKDDGTDGVFVQPAINRIKNAFYLNVNADTGWYQRLKLKHLLLSKIFTRKN
jgi:hypothetical protein